MLVDKEDIGDFAFTQKGREVLPFNQLSSYRDLIAYGNQSVGQLERRQSSISARLRTS